MHFPFHSHMNAHPHPFSVIQNGCWPYGSAAPSSGRWPSGGHGGQPVVPSGYSSPYRSAYPFGFPAGPFPVDPFTGLAAGPWTGTGFPGQPPFGAGGGLGAARTDQRGMEQRVAEQAVARQDVTEPAAAGPIATEPAENGAAARSDGNPPGDPWPLRDYGPEPFVTDIEEATKRNRNFRTALWTGNHLQLTLMSIPEGESIGLERHENVDQFIRIEEGRGLVRMGPSPDRLDFQRAVEEDDVILIPAGIWHNVINTGPGPLKLYSIYAPPEHPRGTIHVTKQEAVAAEA
jgi:mannose-6-phosphate isomerase-like protein (cupin superfamily)